MHETSTTLLRSPSTARAEPIPLASLRVGIESARRHLIGRQKSDGHWVGELQGDTILESEFVLLFAFLGRENDDRVAKAARYIVQHQTADGGWSNYPGGPADVSVSVKAYFALKIAGHDADAPHMQRARATIRELGGAAACNSFTKFYLALLGQFPYANCASVPPEMILLPKWAYVNLYAFSSWTRTIVVPLSIFSAHQPVRHLPEALGIRELFLQPPETPLWPARPTDRWFSWTNFFLGVDWLYKKLSPVLGPVRRHAVRKAATWMQNHCAASDGVGAIFPPMIYTVISLRCLGYADDSPAMRWALKQLDDLSIEENDTLRLQPCFSPVWDTALTLIGLADAGQAGLESTHGVRWLLDREVHQPGDWSATNPHLEPGGWFFEYRNYFYPDTDDTAMVLMALARTAAATGKPLSASPDGVAIGNRWADSGQPETLFPLTEVANAARRGLRWLLGMQNSDGGWAAFDRDINHELLTRVPFADHNAMLDPSCPDITGRALEALGHFGVRIGEPAVDRAVAFLERTQEANGAWPGRWGVNYLYGSWQVLAGLRRIEYDMSAPLVRRTVAWLQKVQQADGGWGESCASYDDPRLAGQGTPTASQTAWALLGLIAAGAGESEAVRRGIQYLLDTQQPDGSWHEEPFTGTGFPKVFYLKYHMYPLYFPLMALARYAEISGPVRSVHFQIHSGGQG